MTHKNLIDELFTGQKIEINELSGGNINAVYHISLSEKELVVKVNELAAFPKMLEKEASGIIYLKDNSPLGLPEVVQFGEMNDLQYLVLEAIPREISKNDFWVNFGKGLAQQHQQSNSHFGFKEDNYIGELPQSNTKHVDWSEFLITERLIPQVKLAIDNGVIQQEEYKKIEAFYSYVAELWPTESPSLLHGDLWSGNFLVGTNDQPVLIDPAVYYGHREMDIGMMHLFGGFDNELFQAYNATAKLENGWQDRISYNQLYPLLVHLNLFGRSYLNQVLSITKIFN